MGVWWYFRGFLMGVLGVFGDFLGVFNEYLRFCVVIFWVF